MVTEQELYERTKIIIQEAIKAANKNYKKGKIDKAEQHRSFAVGAYGLWLAVSNSKNYIEHSREFLLLMSSKKELH